MARVFGAAIALSVVITANAFAADDYCDAKCIASRTPKTAEIHANLDITKDLSAEEIRSKGTKKSTAFEADSLRVHKLLKTSLLDADTVETVELEASVLQSPTGRVELQGVAAISGHIEYASTGSSFLEVGESLHPTVPWKEVHLDRFHDGQATGWMISGLGEAAEAVDASAHVTHCGDDNHFIGGHCTASAHRVARTVTGLPPHTQLRLAARYHFVDNWAGEVGFAQIDGDYVWTDSHTAKPGAGVDMCGNAAHPEARLGATVDVIVPHSEPTAEIAFGAQLPGDSCEQSFGVDDVVVYVR